VFWHTVPLHRLPQLLSDGALRASAYPRPRILARRRKLGLAGFIHLSLTPQTPLLADKCAQGFPHALLAFSPEIAALPGAGFCKYNQMAWRHRDDFRPVTAPDEKALFLMEWRTGKYPSAELLVPTTLSLSYATQLYLAMPEDAAWLETFALPTPPTLVSPETFPPRAESDFTPFWEYATACQNAGALLPPPDLPFD